MKTKLLTGALLAASLVPAAAQAQDWDHNRDHHEAGNTRADDRGGDQRGGDHRGYGRDDRGDGRHDDRRDQRPDDRRGWAGDNRGDHRGYNQGYQGDWHGWRDRHPDYYRSGNWNAPFRYRSFGVGMVMPRDYWAPRYFVNNWDYYRLPRPAYGFYRYVRHYNDILLIDVRNGRVMRVYRGFYR